MNTRYPVTVQRILSEVLALNEMFAKALSEEDKVRKYAYSLTLALWYFMFNFFMKDFEGARKT